ncbi:hypothetical protein FXO38_27198 [Capsicum annuum]|uniref:Endonuclease/exonuclease/phosphatase domain-containing protein n=1 Tax=Capsicum annuum TaxID=4072 RepID=A0A2G2ZN13_CAPAN|nr:hypothetical protein FXO37_30316 [Capsicum annuum]KAF3630351.1 hypothetical protein FXO38_27198 [Capsicum annuum]PHT83379.1 hypothetical protein T459_11822 [Capsicum annuum]
MQEAEIKDFANFIIDTNMTELRTIGRDYTWTNGHTCIIDRALVTSDWIMQMAVVEVLILNFRVSDHFSFKTELHKTCRGGANSFRFFNCLSEHPTFITKVKEA